VSCCQLAYFISIISCSCKNELQRCIQLCDDSLEGSNHLVDLSFIQNIPYSTFFILGLSFLLSLVTLLTNRLLTNREQMKAWNQEISAWRADSLKATRTGDKKLMAKVQKQQKHMMQLQSKLMWQSMKTSFIWFIPLLLVWYIFLPQIIPISNVVAYLPWLSGELELNVFLWYLLCSFLASALFNRLLGLGLGGD